MGINKQRDVEANMQIGPTDLGMVRIFIESQGIEVQWILNQTKPKKSRKRFVLQLWLPAL